MRSCRGGKQHTQRGRERPPCTSRDVRVIWSCWSITECVGNRGCWEQQEVEQESEILSPVPGLQPEPSSGVGGRDRQEGVL